MFLRVFVFIKNLLLIYYEIVNCIKFNNFEVIIYCLYVYSEMVIMSCVMRNLGIRIVNCNLCYSVILI